MTVTDKANRLVPYLNTTFRGRLPNTSMEQLTFVCSPSSKHDHLSHGELSYASRVTKRRIENRDAMHSGLVEIHLVSPNTETTDSEEAISRLEHLLGYLRLGANTKYVNSWDNGEKLILTERVLTQLRLVAGLSKPLDTCLVHPFKEHYLHLFAWERVPFFHARML